MKLSYNVRVNNIATLHQVNKQLETGMLSKSYDIKRHVMFDFSSKLVSK